MLYYRDIMVRLERRNEGREERVSLSLSLSLGTIFAYGQTGTGKTYTMEGIRTEKEKRGVIPNTFEHIFYHIGQSVNEVRN